MHEYSNLKLAEGAMAIHMCMGAMLEISLYSYLYLKLPKYYDFLLSLMFSLQQNQRTRGLNRFCLEVGVGGWKRWEGWGWDGGSSNVYTCGKCENSKIT
jgi:hypothetical protein